MQKTSQFKTQCKGDIIKVTPLKQQKSLCFIPRYAKLQMRPYKTSCCVEHLHLSLLLTFILCKFLYHYVWLIIVDYTTVGLIMLVAHLKWGKGNDL